MITVKDGGWRWAGHSLVKINPEAQILQLPEGTQVDMAPDKLPKINIQKHLIYFGSGIVYNFHSVNSCFWGFCSILSQNKIIKKLSVTHQQSQLICKNLKLLLQVTSLLLISIPFIKIFFLRYIFPCRDIVKNEEENSQSTDQQVMSNHNSGTAY